MPIIQPVNYNDPEGSVDLGSHRGALIQVVRLSGVIGRLGIGTIDHAEHGGVVIDTTNLQVKRIVIYGAINGRSNVLLKATEDVVIGGAIDGRSIVVVEAGNTVLLEDKVDGRSRVLIKAAKLDLRGKVSGGPCTQLFYNCRDVSPGPGAEDGAILEKSAADDPFDLQGPPFEEECARQDPDEPFRFRIPSRARKLRRYLPTGDWEGF